MAKKDDGVTGDMFAGRTPGDEVKKAEAQKALPPGSGAPSKKNKRARGKLRDDPKQQFMFEDVETSPSAAEGPPQTELAAPKAAAVPVSKKGLKKREIGEILAKPSKSEIKKLMAQTGRTELDVRNHLKEFEQLWKDGKTAELTQRLEQFQAKAPVSSSATDMTRSTNRGRANPIPSRGVMTPEVREEGLAVRKPSAAKAVAQLAERGPANSAGTAGIRADAVLAELKRLREAEASGGVGGPTPTPAPSPAPSPALPPSEPVLPPSEPIVPDSSPVPDSRPMPPSDPVPGRPAPTDPLPPPKPKPGKPKGRLQGFKNALKSKGGKYGLAGLAGLTGGMLLQRLMSNPTQINELEESIVRAERDAKSTKVAQLLKQAREEKALIENKQRLAQSAPDLYSAVMAGQRLPKGSVVLGGRPREDLMRQLAASMDSGRYRQQNPLSDLMG